LSSTTIDLPRDSAPSSVERWYVLILMCLIYSINIADRYVVSTVLEPIRLELKLNDAGVAFLTGIPLALFYVAFGIPISWLADRSNRRNILAAALIIWSGFTALCGLSRNYLEFLLGRIGVGVGEAGGTPPSTAIVSDCFPADRRPMAMTVLALGAPIGAWLGADMAGAVAHAYTWRAAFIALGVPGLLVGILVYLTVREPPRGRLDAIVDDIKPSLLESLRFLWCQKAAFHVVMGGGLCALWGWGPSTGRRHFCSAPMIWTWVRPARSPAISIYGAARSRPLAPPGCCRGRTWRIRAEWCGCWRQELRSPRYPPGSRTPLTRCGSAN